MIFRYVLFEYRIIKQKQNGNYVIIVAGYYINLKITKPFLIATHVDIWKIMTISQKCINEEKISSNLYIYIDLRC